MFAPTPNRYTMKSGFTLIELSIVLVIIGLIAGGIMVGRDMMDAAAQRAQIAQIDKYNTAVNLFQAKYNYLPGDIPNPYATNYGFQSRGSFAGEGDGDGNIEGNRTNTSTGNAGIYEGAGETAMFWVDLSTAGMIDGGFNTATSNNPPVIALSASSSPALSAYLPLAKIGNSNYIYVYNGGADNTPWISNGINYFGLSAISFLGTWSVAPPTHLTLSVTQSYNIDKKVDDGYPLTGSVIAQYVNIEIAWVGTASSSTAVAGSSSTCYDNNNSTSNSVLYSTKINNGAGYNCALSFQFQNN